MPDKPIETSQDVDEALRAIINRGMSQGRDYTTMLNLLAECVLEKAQEWEQDHNRTTEE